ncbi:NAD(P)-binding domain-containing protein [Roseobacter sp.]
MPKDATVGLVGFGLISMPMAHRLPTAGYRVSVSNRSLEKA